MHLKKTVFSTGLQLFVTAGNFLFGILMAYYFGTSPDMDAYVVIANIAGIIAGLFCSFQSMGLIPYLSDIEESKRPEIVATLWRFNLCIFASLSFLLIILSDQIVFVLAPGLNPEQNALAGKCLKIIAFYLLGSNAVSFGHALLQFHLRPYLSLLINILDIVLLNVVLIISHIQWGIFSLPFARIISVGVVVLVVLNATRRLGYRFPLFGKTFNEHSRRYAAFLMPIFIGQILIWGIRISDTFLASFLDEGVLSQLTYSLRIVQNFNVLFSGFFIIYYPLLTRLNTQEHNREYISMLHEGFAPLVLASLALATLIAIISPELIAVVFQRGSFTATDTASVASLVRYYSLMMFCAPIGAYLANIYYSRKAPGIATKISAISSLSNIVLNIIFVHFWGAIGLAAASSIAFFIGNALQIIFIGKVNSEYRLRPMLAHVLRAVLTVVPAGIGAVFLRVHVLYMPPYLSIVLVSLGFAVLVFLFSIPAGYPFAPKIWKKLHG